jgi:hypothetical protein
VKDSDGAETGDGGDADEGLDEAMAGHVEDDVI